jgi:hypothetical protein
MKTKKGARLNNAPIFMYGLSDAVWKPVCINKLKLKCGKLKTFTPYKMSNGESTPMAKPRYLLLYMSFMVS